MSKSSLEEYLKSNGEVTYTNMGVSMMPLLRQGKDVFTLRRKGTERCRLGDVVLFRRSSGKFVLHRVIEVHPDDYVIMGDNCYLKEKGIKDEDILGVMTSFVRDGKEHDLNEPGYRLYTFAVMHATGARILWKRGRKWLARKLRMRRRK
jgi:hypothetical protein